MKALYAALVVYGAVMGGTFMYNLPAWCASPNVGHNYLVQPLCGE